MQRKIAANRIYTTPDCCYTNSIVTLSDGTVTDISPLDGEQAMTEWIGGTIVIRDGQVIKMA